jgi:hypothetical protein
MALTREYFADEVIESGFWTSFAASAQGRLWHDSDEPITAGYVRSWG